MRYILVFWLTAASPITVADLPNVDSCRELGDKMALDVKLSHFNCYSYKRTEDYRSPDYVTRPKRARN